LSDLQQNRKDSLCTFQTKQPRIAFASFAIARAFPFFWEGERPREPSFRIHFPEPKTKIPSRKPGTPKYQLLMAGTNPEYPGTNPEYAGIKPESTGTNAE